MVNRTRTPGVGWIERRRALGRAIRRARRAMSQSELGAAVNRPQSCISVWERGGVDLGVDRVYEIEDVLGLRHGTLLAQAGYIDAADSVWWVLSDAPRGGPLDGIEYELPAHLTHFPERVASWLVEFGPIVEAAALVRGSTPADPDTLERLIEGVHLSNLSLGWGLWQDAVEEAGYDPDEVLARWLGRQAVERCRFALEGVSEDGRRLRLIDGDR